MKQRTGDSKIISGGVDSAKEWKGNTASAERDCSNNTQGCEAVLHGRSWSGLVGEKTFTMETPGRVFMLKNGHIAVSSS